MDLPSNPTIAQLVEKLQAAYGLRYFIETGTFLGDTARWASHRFQNVTTIEGADTFWRQARQRHNDLSNVNFLLGDSRTRLAEVASRLEGPAIYWLDAHWSGGATYGEGQECPVLEEVAAIQRSDQDAFILIDDARLFLAPPSHPHRPDQWPDIARLTQALAGGPRPAYVLVLADVVVAVPETARPLVAAYAQEIADEFVQNLPAPLQRPLIPPGADGMDFCVSHGLARPGQRLHLHLGCGEVRLAGYLNLDFPPSAHTVQSTRLAADVFADITTLYFPPGSVDEIRLHHVFEHFDRPTALALLCNWQGWLKPGGLLVIETPDFEAAARRVLGPETGYAEQQVVLRHIFGSHEAAWAAHWDGWFEARFRHVLEALGYEKLVFKKTQTGALNNILVWAHKVPGFDQRRLALTAQGLLRESLVDRTMTEEQLGLVWMQRFQDLLNPAGSIAQAPKVSVILPVQDESAGLAKTLDSLLAQDFQDFEVLIVDRGSLDASLETAYQYAGCDARIRVLPVWRSSRARACNLAAEQADPAARWLLRHPAGDISQPGKLRRLVAMLEADPQIAVLGCQAISSEGTSPEAPGQEPEDSPYRLNSLDQVEASLAPGTALICREVFESLQGYSEAYEPLDEIDFYARALQAGWALAVLGEPLHRSAAGSIQENKVDGLRRAYLMKQIQYRYQKQLANQEPGGRGWGQEVRQGLDLAAARQHYLVQRRLERILGRLRRAFRMAP